MSRPRPIHEPDLDAEQEIDLRSVWSRISARWWLPLAGLLLGIVLGYALALGGGQVYRAETLVYLGVPFTPGGGGVIPNSIATNPRIVGEIVRSEGALRAASRASDIRVSKLRSSISTAAVIAAGQGRTGATTLYEIAVTGAAPRKVERAANALARRVTSTTGKYVDSKLATLDRKIQIDEDELVGINSRLGIAQREQQAALENRELAIVERLLIVTSLNSTLAALEQRRSTVQADLLSAQQLRELAINVEQSRVVNAALASKTTARSTRNASLVGALIGLLLGCAAALLADPFLARRSRTA